ncbi:hypothetical protein [Streptomyces sp. NPDC048385]|uniref:hypothetical protein n=1 Tax=unclassified Streptomyces TaxID=2593676 RepID=UPI003432D983
MSPFTDLLTVTRPLAAPRELTATAGIGSAALQWTMKPQDVPYGEFRVYRSTTLPVDTSTAQWVTCTTSFATLSDGSRRYSCGDFSAEEGTTYHYAVANVQWPLVSSLSDTATVTTLVSDKPPAQVTGLTATATEYGIELDWDDNTEPDLKRYAVYRGTVLGEEGEEQVCSAGEWAHLPAGTSHYRDVRVPDGDHACYRTLAQCSTLQGGGEGHPALSGPEAAATGLGSPHPMTESSDLPPDGRKVTPVEAPVRPISPESGKGR